MEIDDDVENVATGFTSYLSVSRYSHIFYCYNDVFQIQVRHLFQLFQKYSNIDLLALWVLKGNP